MEAEPGRGLDDDVTPPAAGSRPSSVPWWLPAATTLRVDIRDFALITHVVPAERVRPLVPPRFELQTFSEAGGAEMAFISASCFHNHRLHWPPFPRAAVSYPQSTYRTYVTHRGRAATFFLTTYVPPGLTEVGNKVVLSDTRGADFRLDAALGGDGYQRYAASIATDEGEARFELTATATPRARRPFTTGEQLAQFLTYRLHGFSRSALGPVLDGPVAHRRMRPWSGELHDGHFPAWRRLGLLDDAEMTHPYSVLVQPAVQFTVLPAIPAV
jgi:hypothetical protein